MEAHLADFIKDTADGREAETILRTCVHCGFCTATCPTYQLLGDELDGPRGRIYLMKQMLEGGTVTARTQLHLDRCLTCRACETICPSGVRWRRPSTLRWRGYSIVSASRLSGLRARAVAARSASISPRPTRRRRSCAPTSMPGGPRSSAAPRRSSSRPAAAACSSRNM